MKSIPPSSIPNTLSSQVVQAGTGQKTSGPANILPQFEQGQTLRAIVIETLATNQYTLESGGNRFQVESRVPLSTGQSLDLQVMTTGAKNAELQIMPESINQLLGRALASTDNKPDLSPFFQLFGEHNQTQLPNLSDSSLKILQQFAQLHPQVAPGQDTLPPQISLQPDVSQKVLNQVFNQLTVHIGNLLSQGQQQSALTSLQSALQDIALLFQEKGELPQPIQSLLDNLSPASKQIFETISQLQHSSMADTAIKNNLSNQLLQQFQLQPETIFAGNNLTNSLNTLQSGLSELFFLLKGPESMLQLFSTNNFQSEFLTQAQIQSLFAASSSSIEGPDISGAQLQQFIAKLGLSFEHMLAAGNKNAAENTVKSGLLDLVHNIMGQSKLAESGHQALHTLEFLQLTQIQLDRQDTLIVPLPLPFLEQGYLIIENYKDQSDDKGRKKNMPNSFSLFLKLSPLGNLKIDFLYTNKGLYIRFNSDSKQVSDFIATFKDDLNEAISDTFICGVNFTENGEDPLNALIKATRTGEASLLNTKI